MANSSLTLSSLDFDTLKQNFKEFLKTQTVFKDYNFEGSNMNVLLDVMSYNSYLNSFYLNMIASEMFLDSAQKYDSVISHAKELNYIPRSAASSVANIAFVAETVGLNGKLTIPKDTKFFGYNSNNSYTFVTREDKTFLSGNNIFEIDNLQVFEGSYLQDSYVVNYDVENQRFIISNENVDIDSITVTVVENNGATTTTFKKSATLFGIDSFSDVYFLQATENGKYEIVFGDGLFGRRPLNTATIIISYMGTNGSAGNGVDSFTSTDDLGVYNNGKVSIGNISTLVVSQNGADKENINSIKFSAPRYFATQQRAVTTDDYASLIKAEFGGNIDDVAVYGGQDVEPKKYGRVIVCVKPKNSEITPDYLKSRIEQYMLDYIALPNRILINDPEYIYCYIDSTIQYDKSTTDKSESDIKSAVMATISDYSKTNLEKFGNDLRYSRLVASIDGSDDSVVSNQTEFRIIKRITPLVNFKSSFDIRIDNILYFEGPINLDVDHVKIHGSSYDTHFVHATVISSFFTFTDATGAEYKDCYLEDDGEGIVSIFSIVKNSTIKVAEVGTINYTNGELKLRDMIVKDYGQYISIYFRTARKDIFANPNKIIIIDPNDVKLNVTQVIR